MKPYLWMSSAAVVIDGVRVKRELSDFLFHVSMYACKRQPVIFLLLHSFCQRKPLNNEWISFAGPRRNFL